ncbi:MAG: VapE domain-containing protein [Nitrososphaera sp.]
MIDLPSYFHKSHQVGENKWIALCPAHEDKNPSLSIELNSEKWLIHCFAGCGAAEVLDAAGLSLGDLFDRPPGDNNGWYTGQGRVPNYLKPDPPSWKGNGSIPPDLDIKLEGEIDADHYAPNIHPEAKRHPHTNKVLNTRDNLVKLITYDTLVHFFLRFNTLEDAVELNRDIVCHSDMPCFLDMAMALNRIEQPTFDDICHMMSAYAEKAYEATFSIPSFRSELPYAARRVNLYSPVKEYLNRLAWDGTCRLDRWLIECGNCEDSLYTSTLGRKWLISAVARAFEPACQMDYMLVIHGEQGVGKTSLFRTLFEPFYSEDPPRDISQQRAAESLSGIWCMEVSEMLSIRRADIENIKAFISRRVDRYRPAYGYSVVNYPRQAVFCGTTNRDDFLRDDTGNRRFWIVRNHGKVDLAKAKDWKDQLFAEAVAAYKNHEIRYVGDDLLTGKIEEVANDFMEHDDWEDMARDYLAGRKMAKVTECLIFLFPLRQLPFPKADELRLASCFRKLRWKRATRRINGKVQKIWTQENDEEPDA